MTEQPAPAPAPTVAPAAPPVVRAPVPGSGRQTAIVGAILAALFFGSAALNEALPARAEAADPGKPVAIGDDATITPLQGWELSRHEEGDGSRLERGAIVVDVFPEDFDLASDLAQAYLEEGLEPFATELTTSDPIAVQVGAGTGVRFTYQGLFEGADGPIEGEVTAVVAGSSGVLADAWSRQGRLGEGLDEVRRMLDTIVIVP